MPVEEDIGSCRAGSHAETFQLRDITEACFASRGDDAIGRTRTNAGNTGMSVTSSTASPPRIASFCCTSGSTRIMVLDTCLFSNIRAYIIACAAEVSGAV